MNSESILLSMAPDEKERARKVAAGLHLDAMLHGIDCRKVSGLTLTAVINDQVLPAAARMPDGKPIAASVSDLGSVLRGIDIESLAKSFGLAAVNVVREQILPKIREASATAALIASNLLELVEGKLREA